MSLRPELQRILTELERDGVAEMTAQGVAAGNITVLRYLHLKYKGTDLALVIPFGETHEAAAAFAAAHRARFGFDVPGRSFDRRGRFRRGRGGRGRAERQRWKLTPCSGLAARGACAASSLVRIHGGRDADLLP